MKLPLVSEDSSHAMSSVQSWFKVSGCGYYSHYIVTMATTDTTVFPIDVIV